MVLDRSLGNSSGYVSLGFDVAAAPITKHRGLRVVISAVGRTGLAMDTEPVSRIRRGDVIAGVNGIKMSTLPTGPAGRIYLFSVLGATKLRLLMRTYKTIVGCHDATGSFTPLTTP